MNIVYKKTEGTQTEKPLTIDTLSSKTKVYLRKNIERVTKVDKITEETYEVWQYDEAIITHQEYEQIAGDWVSALEETTSDTNDTIDVILTEELPAQAEQISEFSDTMDDVLTEELPAQSEQIQGLADTIDDLLTNVIPSLGGN